MLADMKNALKLFPLSLLALLCACAGDDKTTESAEQSYIIGAGMKNEPKITYCLPR